MDNATSWVEISRSALENNVGLLRSIGGPEVAIGCCIKANAYGHGLEQVAPIAYAAGSKWLSVFSLDEARRALVAAPQAQVLILGTLEPAELVDACSIGAHMYLTPTLLDAIPHLKLTAKPKIHLKIDTGLSRLGWLNEELSDVIPKIKNILDQVELVGLGTHFSEADDPRSEHSWVRQLDSFQKASQQLAAAGLTFTYRHASNSSALLAIPDARFNLVRPGLLTYGAYPGDTLQQLCQEKGYGFQPALSWKTRVVGIHTIPARTAVGYGGTYITKRPTRIALLPVGYYDGVDRRFGNRGSFLVGGQRAPILGRIYMNMTTLDVTDIPKAKVGSEVVMIGSQGADTLTVEEQAATIDTINYELTTRIPVHVSRRLV